MSDHAVGTLHAHTHWRAPNPTLCKPLGAMERRFSTTLVRPAASQVGFVAGVIPFLIASFEFGKRIVSGGGI